MMSTGTTTPRPPEENSGGLFARRHRALSVGIIVVVTLVAFEEMAVTTIMPVAVRDLHGLSMYAWSFSAFLTASLFGTVVAGELSDRRGPTPPYYAGLTVFVVGLLLAGSAQGMGWFVLARAVQGLGGGGVIVALYIVIARSYGEDLRPRVFAAMSSAWVLPALIGPAVAGFVADYVGWRWVFLGLLPLVVPPVVMMAGSLRRCGGPESGAPGVRAGAFGRRVVPAAALAVGATCVLYSGQHLVWASLLPLAAGLVLVAYGLVRLLPRGALRMSRGLPAAVIMRGLFAAAFFGTEAFIPLGLTTLRGFTASAAGLALTGGAIGWAAGSWIQGRPRARMPRHRFVTVGATCLAAGIALVALTLWPPISGWVALPAWLLAGFGMGLAYPTFSVLVLELSPAAERGANSSALQVCDMLGSALSAGLGGVVLAAFHDRHAPIGWAITVTDAFMVVVAIVAIATSARLAVSGERESAFVGGAR